MTMRDESCELRPAAPETFRGVWRSAIETNQREHETNAADRRGPAMCRRTPALSC